MRKNPLNISLPLSFLDFFDFWLNISCKPINRTSLTRAVRVSRQLLPSVEPRRTSCTNKVGGGNGLAVFYETLLPSLCRKRPDPGPTETNTWLEYV